MTGRYDPLSSMDAWLAASPDRIRWLREQVRVGLEQARRGEFVDADVVFQRLEREIDDQEAKRDA